MTRIVYPALMALIASFDPRHQSDAALQAEIRIARRLLDSGHDQAAGAMLRVFRGCPEMHARLQAGLALTPEQADQQVDAAQRIRTVLGIQGRIARP